MTGDEFGDRGVRITVRAKWIKADNDRQQICITPIAGPEERTPEYMRRYLAQNGIVLKEVLPGGRPAAGADGTLLGHAVKDILALTPSDQKSFLEAVVRLLGFSYAPNVPVTFPYAGIQIQAYANLVSIPGGTETLVDFGNLYGDALAQIRNSGMVVVSIDAGDGYGTVLRKVLTALGRPFEDNPVFLAANRSAQYNTTVAVQGLLCTNPDNQRTLFTPADLPGPVSDLLNAEGVAVVTW
ncbi:MAG: hypothetical protein KJP07_03220 [Desulfatitalea sp.]|nr:hypothetical protein [Desulfatitalea sp.]